MPLEDLEHIDMVVGPNEDGRIGLVITDSGLTTDPEQRLELIQEKLRRYTLAILDEEGLLKDHSGKTPGDFYIQIVCARRPTEAMMQIQSLRPRSHPDVEILVVIEEFPEGAWASSDEVPAVDDSPGMTELDEELMAFAEAALDVGLKWIEDSAPLFVMYQNGNERALTPIENCQDQDSIEKWVKAWAASMPAEVICAVFVGQTVLSDGEEEKPVLLLQCHRRGTSETNVLVQVLKKKLLSKKLVADGAPCFFNQVPNIFPAA